MDINDLGQRWMPGTFRCGCSTSRHSSGEVQGCVDRQKALTIVERSVLRTLVTYELEKRTCQGAYREGLENIQRKLRD